MGKTVGAIVGAVAAKTAIEIMANREQTEAELMGLAGPLMSVLGGKRTLRSGCFSGIGPKRPGAYPKLRCGDGSGSG